MPGPILLCTDGSEAADHAIAACGSLFPGAAAVAFHVWLPASQLLLWNPRIEGPGTLAEAAAELDSGVRGRAERMAEEAAARARDAGLDAVAAIAENRGGRWRTILREADARDAAAIVLGRRGGSITAGVLHHAECPVLVIPGGQGEAAPGAVHP